MAGVTASKPKFVQYQEPAWSELETAGVNASLIFALHNMAPRLLAALEAKGEVEDARPLSEWHEDMGDVLWWSLPVEEAPFVGRPEDGAFPVYMTHWTPLPKPPKEPCTARAAAVEGEKR